VFGRDIDKKIHVAVVAIISTHNGPEHPDISCAVTRRNVEDFAAKTTDHLERHASMIVAEIPSAKLPVIRLGVSVEAADHTRFSPNSSAKCA
jgi:hypothetical protein